MHIHILTLVQAINLPAELLAQREVIHLDLVTGQLSSGEHIPEQVGVLATVTYVLHPITHVSLL